MRINNNLTNSLIAIIRICSTYNTILLIKINWLNRLFFKIKT